MGKYIPHLIYRSCSMPNGRSMQQLVSVFSFITFNKSVICTMMRQECLPYISYTLHSLKGGGRYLEKNFIQIKLTIN